MSTELTNVVASLGGEQLFPRFDLPVDGHGIDSPSMPYDPIDAVSGLGRCIRYAATFDPLARFLNSLAPGSTPARLPSEAPIAFLGATGS
jgi:hypothetical protein